MSKIKLFDVMHPSIHNLAIFREKVAARSRSPGVLEILELAKSWTYLSERIPRFSSHGEF